MTDFKFIAKELEPIIQDAVFNDDAEGVSKVIEVKIAPLVAELAQVKIALQARDKDYHEAYGHYSDATIELTALKAKLEVAVEALKYIVEHEWAAEKDKWVNEFIDVASEALASIEELGRKA